MAEKTLFSSHEQLVRISIDSEFLEGMLSVPQGAKAVVLFAHGSGSSRFSPRNNFVASVLREVGVGTLLFDLLTQDEDMVYANRFDIDLLAHRLVLATNWLKEQPQGKGLQIGYFGASTGAAAALQAVTEVDFPIFAIVSRGGRPDLAMFYLPKVKAPTLLIVGGFDVAVIELNQRAYEGLDTEKELVIVPRATHLFQEPGALEEVARLAADWFASHARTEAVRC